MNTSLNDASHILYISDRGNNIIRGMSATCSFKCENNGRCIGPDLCQCLPGWSGIDCTKPLCQEFCGPRKLCVAPNTCNCIPGYLGNDCLQASCAQECKNGLCSAPDVCTCVPGWFDPNCVSSLSDLLYVFQLYLIHTHSSARRRLCVSKLVEMEVSFERRLKSKLSRVILCRFIPPQRRLYWSELLHLPKRVYWI